MARKEKDLEQLLRSYPALQEQLEERIAEAIAQARAQWEAEMTVKSAEPDTPAAEPMNADRQALEAEREALEAEKAAFARQRMEVAVGQELGRRNLPTAFAPWLTGETTEESVQRIETFEVLFQEAIAATVTNRMRGAGAPRAPPPAHSYSREELRNMTHQEINANWEAVRRALEGCG